MGIGTSQQTKIEREFGGLADGDGQERFFGLENFGNTCYCNSVLQALYFCEPLRHHLAQVQEEDANGGGGSGGNRSGNGGGSGRHGGSGGGAVGGGGNSKAGGGGGGGVGSGVGGSGGDSVNGGGGGAGGIGGGGGGGGGGGSGGNSLLSQLAELFSSISKQKRRSGHLAPTEFLRTLRERNVLFRGNTQQDAHEFFNFVLNEMADSMVARNRRKEEEREAARLEKREHFQLNKQGSNSSQQHYHNFHNGVQNASNGVSKHQHNNHSQNHLQQQQQQQQQDPRKSSPWSKMPLFKGGFGSGAKNGPTLSGTEGTAGVDQSAAAAGGGGGNGPAGGARGQGNEAPSAAAAETATNGGRGGQAAAGSGGNGNAKSRDDASDSSAETWVHRIFQGVLTNQTKCLCCETVSNRDEPFMDLSLDVEQNSSVTSCLRSFSSTETLTHKNKFFCESCNALQEAEKKIRLKRLPRVLTLHLKRFKYFESLGSFSKLSHRVVFPLELRAPNMTDPDGEADADDRLYRLFAVVVHIGLGPNRGHYVAVVKSGGRWLLFDDDVVELVNEQVLKQCYGLARPAGTATNTGYLLLYDCGE